MAKRVNLDAMIPRADFGDLNRGGNQERVNNLGLSSLQDGAPIFKTLRKPDFQRETNHWSARQVADLIKSFLDDELVPALILWDSTTYIFVIDGGHRLSALKAWIADDYGDGVISQNFYGGNISKDQKSIAASTRKLVEKEIGRFSDLEKLVAMATASDSAKLERANRMFRRVLTLQWVVGTKEVAESSFYKINSQGTALDDVETSLIKNRRRPIAIAARAIIRSGSGHKYWSDFDEENQNNIVKISAEIYKHLFEPEIESPVKTLDMPLGGSVSPVDALALLIDFLAIAGRKNPEPCGIADYDEDFTGEETLAVLKRALLVVQRMTSNHGGSLGLHPAVYYYGDRGKHSKFLFLGMVSLITKNVLNNNTVFFKKFTNARMLLEKFLIENKSLITLMLQNMHNKNRTAGISSLFEYLVDESAKGVEVRPEDALQKIGISGKVYELKFSTASREFSDEAKSQTFVNRAIKTAITCSICNGLLDSNRSMSYDHIQPKREGGLGAEDNCDLVHPFCNTAMKN